MSARPIRSHDPAATLLWLKTLQNLGPKKNLPDQVRVYDIKITSGENSLIAYEFVRLKINHLLEAV